jgi:hypothetical protein
VLCIEINAKSPFTAIFIPYLQDFKPTDFIVLTRLAEKNAEKLSQNLNI